MLVPSSDSLPSAGRSAPSASRSSKARRRAAWHDRTITVEAGDPQVATLPARSSGAAANRRIARESRGGERSAPRHLRRGVHEIEAKDVIDTEGLELQDDRCQVHPLDFWGCALIEGLERGLAFTRPSQPVVDGDHG